MSALTAFGATSVIIMVVAYGLEERAAAWILVFAIGCALSSTYGFLAGTWPFGVVEAFWAVVAVMRWRRKKGMQGPSPQGDTGAA